MVKFCRNCGKELAAADDKVCKSCGANAVKGTTYCRYCAHPTSVDNATCPHCGAAIKPLSSSVRTLFEYPRLSAKMGKIINLSIVAVLVTLYVVFSLPKAVTKPIKATASSAVVAAVGYSSLPLNFLTVSPFGIPKDGLTTVAINNPFGPPRTVIVAINAVAMNAPHGPTKTVIFPINATQQLTIYALYKNPTTSNATGTGRVEDVTAKSTYQSSNDKIATVTPDGLVQGVAVGSANITVSYTAAPGSANLSEPAAGKIPITISVVVPVFVGIPFYVPTTGAGDIRQ